MFFISPKKLSNFNGEEKTSFSASVAKALVLGKIHKELGLWNNSRATCVGFVNKSNRSKIFKNEEDGTGELLIGGRHVFIGYLNEREKTREAVDEEHGRHSQN